MARWIHRGDLCTLGEELEPEQRIDEDEDETDELHGRRWRRRGIKQSDGDAIPQSNDS